MAGLGIFVFLIGIAAAAYGWKGHSQALALKQAAGRWPMVPGTILASDVQVMQRAGSPCWVPLIRYRYQVGGQQFEGERIRFGFVGTQTRAGAERMIAGYPVGSTGMLRYDPNDPRESVLDSDHLTSNMLICAIGGAVLVVMGLAIAFVA